MLTKQKEMAIFLTSCFLTMLRFKRITRLVLLKIRDEGTGYKCRHTDCLAATISASALGNMSDWETDL